MSYTYTTWLSAIAQLAVQDPTGADFLAIIPSVIDYAEQRMYRELDLLDTVTRDTATLSANDRNLTLPQNNGRFVVTNGINLITPASTAPDSGTRNPLTPVNRDVLDYVWPSNTTGAGVPEQYAMITDQTVILGPAPDDTYEVEVIGTIRPNPLSVSNTTTYLTLYLPDLFVAASMVFVAGWQKDYGQQSDDPNLAVSWESQYTKLFASALVEEERKRYAAGAWGSLSPTPIATPGRGGAAQQ